MAIDLLAAVISCIIGFIIGVMNPFKNLGKQKAVQNVQPQNQKPFYNPQMQSPPVQQAPAAQPKAPGKLKLSKPLDIKDLPDDLGEPI